MRADKSEIRNRRRLTVLNLMRQLMDQISVNPLCLHGLDLMRYLEFYLLETITYFQFHKNFRFSSYAIVTPVALALKALRRVSIIS